MFGLLKRLFSGGGAAETGPNKRDPNRIRRLRGDGEFSVKAAGTSHYQAELAAVKGGFRKHSNPDFLLDVVPEPTNPHDANALRLEHNGTLVGYIPAFMASEVHDALSRVGQDGQRCRVLARIVGHDKVSLGLRLNMQRPARF